MEIYFLLLEKRRRLRELFLLLLLLRDFSSKQSICHYRISWTLTLVTQKEINVQTHRWVFCGCDRRTHRNVGAAAEGTGEVGDAHSLLCHM